MVIDYLIIFLVIAHEGSALLLPKLSGDTSEPITHIFYSHNLFHYIPS